MTDTERAFIGEGLRPLLTGLDDVTREAMVQNLCCPWCGGGIECERQAAPRRRVTTDDFMISHPGLLKKHGPGYVLGYAVTGLPRSFIKCTECSFRVIDGTVIGPRLSTTLNR